MAKDPGLFSFSPCLYFCCFIQRPKSVEPIEAKEIALTYDKQNPENGKIVTEDKKLGSYGATNNQAEEPSWSDLAKSHQQSDIKAEKEADNPVEVRHEDTLRSSDEEQNTLAELALSSSFITRNDTREITTQEKEIVRTDEVFTEDNLTKDIISEEDDVSDQIIAPINTGYEVDSDIHLDMESLPIIVEQNTPQIHAETVLTQLSTIPPISENEKPAPIKPATSVMFECVSPTSDDIIAVQAETLLNDTASNTPISDTSTLVPTEQVLVTEADKYEAQSYESIDVDPIIVTDEIKQSEVDIQPVPEMESLLPKAQLSNQDLTESGVFSDGDMPFNNFYSSTEFKGSTASLDIDKKKKSKFRFKKLKFKKKKKGAKVESDMISSKSTPSLAGHSSISGYSTMSKYSAGTLLASLDDLSDDDICHE